MKIGVFGGSFNPIHNGHLNAAKEILRLTEVEEIWFMPCYKNPLKKGNSVSLEQRLEMAKLAVEGLKGLKASDFEIKNKICYSLDSIRALKKEFPQHEFYFILGSNLVQEFSKWKQPREIVKEVSIIIVPLPELKEIKEKLLENALVLRKAKRVNVSSTMVRERVRAGKSIKGLVPAAVEQYIKENNLYK